MSEDKQEKIKKLLMQKKFIALDREQGVEASGIFLQMMIQKLPVSGKNIAT